MNSDGIFLKPLFTEIEKNNCFSIYTRSDLNKIREETVKKYDLIDGSNHAKVRSWQNFQTWQFTSLSLRTQQRNGSKWNRQNFELFP